MIRDALAERRTAVEDDENNDDNDDNWSD